jgi:glycerophosphoryl diester phosphodiesterase
MSDRPVRHVSDTQVLMSQLMLPGDANPQGNVHGGAIMKLVDTAAGVAAVRHVRGPVVTARIDSMSFLEPVFIGDLVTLKASVNEVGTTSLEVGVRVEAENLISGVVRHVSSAYLVFVAIDETGRPRPVPPFLAESPEQQRRMSEAKQRRSHRQRGEEALRQLRSAPAAGPGNGRAALAGWTRPGAAVAVIGHRGAGGLAPENTLPSFELALALGADAVECDVHLSADGVPVILHDRTLERTTNGRGLVGQQTVAELKLLDASHRYRDLSPARIPTLDELLTWARGRTCVVIELKGTEQPGLVEKTIDTVREHEMVRDAFLISFDHEALRRVRQVCPEALTGALYVARLADPIGLARAAAADALCPEWSTMTPSLVAVAHAAGLAVATWTPNDLPAIRSALTAGVDAITTDFPDRVRASASADR